MHFCSEKHLNFKTNEKMLVEKSKSTKMTCGLWNISVCDDSIQEGEVFISNFNGLQLFFTGG